ncbi:MAG TPA: hypothetical protein DIU15_05425 [Deltaproteobacteria bacterium]|nr:hypothetical protein [Deltaproteobacteria bacterium]
MKRVLGIALICFGIVSLLWWRSGLELRGDGQSLAPGGVAATSEETPAPVADPVADRTMADGVALLYEHEDPEAAIEAFDAVLQRNPAHYGALYQRAKALDERRQLNRALDAWRRFEPEALAVSDMESLKYARERIGILDQWVTRLQATMNRALTLLYQESAPEAAIPLFVEVLTNWPTHYGALYQYAYALEEVDDVEGARRAWAMFLVQAHALQAKLDIAAANEALERLGSY